MRVPRRVVSLFLCMAAGTVAVRASDLNGFVREKDHGDVAPSVTFESYDEF